MGSSGTDGARRAQMARVSALLFGAAALVTAAGLLLPHQAQVDETGLAVVAAAAALATAVCALGRERLPAWAFPLLAAFGTGIISLSLIFNGERHGGGAGNDEMYFLWIALYAAYYFGRAMTALQLGIIAAAYAGTLVVVAPGDVSVSRWLSTIGLVTGGAVVVRLLSERIGRLLAELAEAARTDHLTGLPNRRAFEQAMEQELARVDRGGPGFSVILADLDCFKQVNDQFGHELGDRLLVDTARSLEHGARSGDLVARLGGDEFALLLPATGLDGAQELGGRVALSLCEQTSAAGFPIGLSIGVAGHGPDGRTMDELLRVADERLYEQKRVRVAGRVTRRRRPSTLRPS